MRRLSIDGMKSIRKITSSTTLSSKILEIYKLLIWAFANPLKWQEQLIDLLQDESKIYHNVLDTIRVYTICKSGKGNTPDTLKACIVRLSRLYGGFVAQKRCLTPWAESP